MFIQKYAKKSCCSLFDDLGNYFDNHKPLTVVYIALRRLDCCTQVVKGVYFQDTTGQHMRPQMVPSMKALRLIHLPMNRMKTPLHNIQCYKVSASFLFTHVMWVSICAHTKNVHTILSVHLNSWHGFVSTLSPLPQKCFQCCAYVQWASLKNTALYIYTRDNSFSKGVYFQDTTDCMHGSN